MPDDKRPKPVIDMIAEHTIQPVPRLERPEGNGGPAGIAAAAPPVPKQPQRSGRGFIGYLLAGIFGGVAATSGTYLILKLDIPSLSLTAPATQRQIKDLQDRTASLESALRAMSRNSPSAAYAAAGSGEGLHELRSRLDGLVSAAHGLDQRVQLLEQNSGSGATRDAIQAEIASQVAPLSQRLATAERSLEAIARVQNERQADARSAALTLALTNLKRAISDGRPFAAELAAVGNLSAAKLPVLQLSPYQDEGVLSIAQLQSEFAEASQKTIERHYSNKSKTFMGEVLSRAKSAIQVRPADSTGDTVEAILGRMSAPLWAGDLKGALIQGAALSDPPQEMKNWFGKAQARVAADDALRKTDQEILASLTKAAAPRH